MPLHEDYQALVHLRHLTDTSLVLFMMDAQATNKSGE